MKNLIRFIIITLFIGFISCESNESVEKQPEARKVIAEFYNPKVIGNVIDAVYNGNNVKLLEIEEGNYLYGGDVVLERKDFSLPGEFNGKGVYAGGIWPNRTVRWKYATGVSNELKTKWNAATAVWNKDLGFTFTEIGTRATGDYILVQQNSNKNAFSTSIGRKGGLQTITIDPSFHNSGTLIHEIGHAMGLIHEQNRPDRDEFITINVSNIRPEWAGQFENCSNCTTSGTFDFNSIMLYSASGNNNIVIDVNIPAMTKKDGTIWTTNRSSLSDGDKAAIQLKY